VSGASSTNRIAGSFYFMLFPKRARQAIVILFFIAVIPRIYATSTMNIFFDALWKQSTLVASGTVTFLGDEDQGGWQLNKYKMRINKVYKGKAEQEIIFYNFNNSLAAPDRDYKINLEIELKSEKEYLIFIRSILWPNNAKIVPAGGLEIKQADLSEIEHAIQYCKDLDQAADPAQRKAVLLKEAKQYNSFTSLSSDSEINHYKYMEAIPIYLERLKGSNAYKRTSVLGSLAGLGYDRKELSIQIEKWLNEPNWSDYYGELFIETWGCEFVPVLRKFINSKDELLAGCVQKTLLRCGNP
jgi:hypothetical protein